VFGVSFTEFLVVGTVALLVLGPDKLPGMLRTMGQWIAKLRKLTTEVRHQSGIDEVLRAEGFDGGLNELRSMMRGGAASIPMAPPVRPLLPESFVADKSREYPPEGPDAYGALPEDLLEPPAPASPALPEAAPAEALPSDALPSAGVAAATASGPESSGATIDPPEAAR
jgi:sec-independent protein translocase protein TatB